jgi:hypothetical protein
MVFVILGLMFPVLLGIFIFDHTKGMLEYEREALFKEHEGKVAISAAVFAFLIIFGFFQEGLFSGKKGKSYDYSPAPVSKEIVDLVESSKNRFKSKMKDIKEVRHSVEGKYTILEADEKITLCKNFGGILTNETCNIAKSVVKYSELSDFGKCKQFKGEFDSGNCKLGSKSYTIQKLDEFLELSAALKRLEN